MTRRTVYIKIAALHSILYTTTIVLVILDFRQAGLQHHLTWIIPTLVVPFGIITLIYLVLTGKREP